MAMNPRATGAATRAVVLAAGRGRRMREPYVDETLDAAQRRQAERGAKALIPFYGQPYLSYGLSALADGGISEVCVVVNADDDSIQRAYERLAPRRLRLTFAVQREPLGSADALRSAEQAVGWEPFVLVNGDNVYPAPVVERVRTLPGSGLAAFRRDGLLAGGIPASRIASFALVAADNAGCLEHIEEKPGEAAVHAAGAAALVSMTCWRFEHGIFDACASIAPSARGEYEIPDAVSLAMRSGVCFRVLEVCDAVLDLTSRADVAVVAERLRGVRVLL